MTDLIPIAIIITFTFGLYSIISKAMLGDVTYIKMCAAFIALHLVLNNKILSEFFKGWWGVQ